MEYLELQSLQSYDTNEPDPNSLVADDMNIDENT